MNILIINAGSSSLKYQLVDPDTGEKFFADTHAIFFTRGICQPLMEDYANTAVTLAVNRVTGMVVVIG